MRFPAFIALICISHTTLAGWYYESRTTCQGDDSTRVKALNHTTRTWLNGEKTKVEFLTSQHPVIQPGSYMVSTDGGTTIHLVNPDHKNYYLMDLAAMRGMVGGMMQILNPVIEKVSDEPNGTILDHPVRHVKFRATYDLQIAVLGIKDRSTIETGLEVWAAESITDPGSTFWTGQSGYATGNDEFDAMMHHEAEQIKGLPLRKVMTVLSTDASGKVKETVSRMDVLSITSLEVPDEIFAIPDDYEETSFLKMQNPAGMTKVRKETEENAPEADTGSVREMMDKFNQPESQEPAGNTTNH